MGNSTCVLKVDDNPTLQATREETVGSRNDKSLKDVTAETLRVSRESGIITTPSCLCGLQSKLVVNGS